MKIKIIFYSLAVFLLMNVSCKPEKLAKGSGILNFTTEHVFGSKSLQLNSNLSYKNSAGNLFDISTCKYFLSNFILVNDKGDQLKLNNYELIDLEKSAQSFKYDKIANGNYTKLIFNIGVDSIANATGNHTGALDPANNMDWGWNFGYRFLVLEGRYKATDTSAEKNYSYHIGTNVNLVTIDIPINFAVNDDLKTIALKFDAEKLFGTPNKWNISLTDYSHSGNQAEILSMKDFVENMKSCITISSIK